MLPGVTSNKFYVENVFKNHFSIKKSLENQSKMFLGGGKVQGRRRYVYIFICNYTMYSMIEYILQFCVAFCHSVKAELNK